MKLSSIPCPDVPEVVLLDLNYTLVGNSHETMYGQHYDRETYRGWLVDLLRASGAHVALVTVRPFRFLDRTLDRIAAQLGGWQPDEAHFNDRGWNAPAWKSHVLHDRILPRFRGRRILAVESNAEVHRVYERNGVPWCKVEKIERWPSLPRWGAALPAEPAQRRLIG